MRLRNIIKRLFLFAVLPAMYIFSACDSENYMKFDVSHSGVYFTKDTLSYSFGVTPVEIKEYTYNIPVNIMGGISSEKREISYVIDSDSTFAEEGVHYEIGEAVIMPDSVRGVIPVRIFRDNLAGSYELGYTRYKICIRLVKNEFFAPTLDSLSQVRIFRFDNSIEQPEWLSRGGDKIWYESYFGKWHPFKLIKMVEYFHAFEKINPETYKKIAAKYGDNLEHIPEGYPFDYRTTFVKYVFYPMYEYFNDPANEEYIRSVFPDFPFDFPDPYST